VPVQGCTLLTYFIVIGRGMANQTAIETRDWDTQGYCYHPKINLKQYSKPFAYVPENHA
jgi:hypothetical protein